MLVNEQKKLNIESVSLMERGFDPDTYIVRISLGRGQFLDSVEAPAESALRLYKSLIIDERFE